VRKRVRQFAVLITMVAVLMAGAAPAAFGPPGRSGEANCVNQQTAWPELPDQAHNDAPQGNYKGDNGNTDHPTNAAWQRCPTP